MGLLSAITSVFTNKREVKERLRQNINDLKKPMILGFSLLTEEEQESYLDKLADVIAGKEYSLIAAANWLLSSPSTIEIMTEIQENIRLAAAKKVLSNMTFHVGEDEISIERNLPYIKKQECILGITSWFKDNPLEVANVETIDYRQGKLSHIFSNAQREVIDSSQKIMKRDLDAFDVGFEIFEKISKSELADEGEVTDDMDYYISLLGVQNDKYFNKAYLQFVEALNEGFDDPRYHKLSELINEGQIDLTEILQHAGREEFDSFKANLNSVFSKMYMATEGDLSSKKEDLIQLLKTNYPMLLEVVEAAYENKNKEKEINRIFLKHHAEKDREMKSLIQIYDELYKEDDEFAFGFSLLEPEVAERFFIEYSSTSLEEPALREGLKNRVAKAIEDRKVELLCDMFEGVSSSSFNDIDNFISAVQDDSRLGEIAWPFSDDITIDEIKATLYEEKNEETTGFSLLRPEAKKESVMLFIEGAIRGKERETSLKMVGDRIQKQVKSIVARRKIDILGNEYSAYELLDRGNVDEFGDDSFKTVARKNFLSFYREEKEKGDSSEEIVDRYLHSDNTRTAELERTAKRFYLLNLSDKLDENLYDVFVNALLQNSGTKDPFKMHSGGELDVVHKYTEILKRHIDVPLSKYLRVALDNGASIEYLFKKDGSSFEDAKSEINERLKIGFSTIDLVSGEGYVTLNTMLETILLKARDNATRYLEDKAEKVVKEFLGENVYWLDHDNVDLVKQNYVEQVLTGNKSFDEWSSSIGNVVRIAKARKLLVLEELKNEMDLYNIDLRKKASILKMAEKEVFTNLKSGENPNIDATLEHLRKKYSLKKIRRTTESGSVEQVDIADLSEYSRILADKEEIFRKIDVYGDDNVRLNKAHVAMSAGKRAIEKKALAHYFDVMFETVVGMERLTKLDYLKDEEQIHLQMLRAMQIPEDMFEELKTNESLYEQLKAKFITFRTKDLDVTDSDNRVQVSLKSKIHRLEVKQDEDHKLENKAAILHRGPIRKRIEERDKELARLHLELQYENQRALFARFSKEFDKNVKKPILQENDTNKHIVSFVSAIGQSLQATASFDFGAAAANIVSGMSDKWEERKLSFAEAILLGKVHDIADSLIGGEVEKEVGKLFRNTSKHVNSQLRLNARALEQLKEDKLMPDELVSQLYTIDSDSNTTAVMQGFMDLVRRTCLGKKIDVPNQTIIRHALYKTYASIIAQTEETGAVLLDALKVINRNNFNKDDLENIEALKQELEGILSEFVKISEDMSSLEVRSALELNREQAKKILKLNEKLDELSRASKEPALIGLSTTFNAVTANIGKVDGVLSNISKFILDNADIVEEKISAAGVSGGSWKETLLLNLQSMLVDQSMGLGLARDKVMLKKYVTHMIHEHGDPDFKVHKIKNINIAQSAESLLKLNAGAEDTGSYSIGSDTDENDASFDDLVEKAKRNIDTEIRNTTPFNENANRNKFVRGLCKFLNRVVYFFKNGKLPPSNLLISQRVREVNNMFQAKFHEERAKSKIDIMLNVSRLMSSMGDVSEPCRKYADSLSGILTEEGAIISRYLCDEHSKLSLSMFPEMDLEELKSKHFTKKKKDVIGFQRELEELMLSIDPKRYNEYKEQIQNKIPSIVYSNKDSMNKVQGEDFRSRKKAFASYGGDVNDLSPKELKPIMMQYNLVCQEQKALVEMKKEKRKSAWFRFISFFKADRYTDKIRDLEKQKDFLLSKMVSCDVENSFKGAKKEFVENVEAKEFPSKFDPLTIKDQKIAALVAVKHMFETVGHVGVRHMGVDAADKLISRDGKVKVKGMIADVVNLGINIPSEKTFRKMVSKGAKALTFLEYENEMSYIKRLSESFEENPPQVIKIEGVDATWQESRDKYSQWLHSADRDEVIRKELERLGEIQPERSLYEQIFIDSLQSLSSKVQGALALKTSLMRYSSAFLKKVELDPSSIDNSTVDTFFGAVKETFVEQRIINLKVALNIVKDKPGNPWVIKNKEVFDRLEKIQKEINELDKIKRQLANTWAESGSSLDAAQKKEIFKQLERIRHLKIEYGHEISKDLDVLCKSSPDTDDMELVEGFCFVSWSESYIQFYGDIFEKIHMSADELLQQREIVSDSRFETRGTENGIQKRFAGMFESLGEMVSNKINAAPIEQIHSYMARQELKDLELDDEHELRDEVLARASETRTIRSVVTSDDRISATRSIGIKPPSSADDADQKLR